VRTDPPVRPAFLVIRILRVDKTSGISRFRNSE
jgi:hypothetical protein